MANKQLSIVGDTAADRIFDAWKKHLTEQLSHEDKCIMNRIVEVEKRFYEKKLVKDNQGKETNVSRPWKWKDLVDWLVETYKISTRQAYADIELAKDFFLLGRGRNDIEFARGYRVQQGEELMYRCMDGEDYRAAAAFFREIVKLDVLERKDDGGVDPLLFQPVNLIIVADPSELGFPKMEKPDKVVERLLASYKRGAMAKMVDDAQEIETEGE